MEIKNTKILRFALIIGLAWMSCCMLACKKNSISDADYARPVVESYLVPGTAVQVKVYYQKYLEDTISYGFPITGLKLKISDGSSTVQLTESKEGTYVYTDTTFIRAKKTYTLNFDYTDKVISAQTTVPDKPTGFKASATEQYVPPFSMGGTQETFKPVTFSWNNTASWYYMMVLKNVEASPTKISSRPGNSNLNSEVSLGQTSSWQTQQMTFNYLGNYKVLLVHINKEYSDALNNNGGSSLNLTNPSTNITNGLGIFTAMQADTLNLKIYTSTN
jgi:hypothetical protein